MCCDSNVDLSLISLGCINLCRSVLVTVQAKSGELRQVLARLQLSSMESPDSLIAAAEVAGFELLDYEDTTPSLVQHFTAILEVRLQSHRSRHNIQSYTTYMHDLISCLQ